jgi:hypothetical protein
VQPDYFRTLGIRLLEGRVFTSAEMESGEAVIINRAAARHFWPDASPIGRRLRVYGNPWTTVVGIVDDAGAGGLTQERHAPQFFWPYRSQRVPRFFGAPPSRRSSCGRPRILRLSSRRSGLRRARSIRRPPSAT